MVFRSCLLASFAAFLASCSHTSPEAKQFSVLVYWVLMVITAAAGAAGLRDVRVAGKVLYGLILPSAGVLAGLWMVPAGHEPREEVLIFSIPAVVWVWALRLGQHTRERRDKESKTNERE